MSIIFKQLVIHKLNIPQETINIVKEYLFHKIKKIPKNDERYDMLLTIPYKEYDSTNDTTFVYLSITAEKDYFLVYTNFNIQLQTFQYTEEHGVQFIEGFIFLIE